MVKANYLGNRAHQICQICVNLYSRTSKVKQGWLWLTNWTAGSGNRKSKNCWVLWKWIMQYIVKGTSEEYNGKIL